jgi:hypothetical protein
LQAQLGYQEPLIDEAPHVDDAVNMFNASANGLSAGMSQRPLTLTVSPRLA